MFASSCSDENTTVTIKVPVLTTTAVSCGGNITSDGGSTVTVRGVCWGESPTVTVTDKNTTDGTGTGSYTSSITGLTGNTTYYVRAYATNSKGTGYGSAKTFTTLPASNQVPGAVAAVHSSRDQLHQPQQPVVVMLAAMAGQLLLTGAYAGALLIIQQSQTVKQPMETVPAVSQAI